MSTQKMAMRMVVGGDARRGLASAPGRRLLQMQVFPANIYIKMPL